MADLTHENATDATATPPPPPPPTLAPTEPSVPFTPPTVEPVSGLAAPVSHRSNDFAPTKPTFEPTPLPPFPAPHPHQLVGQQRRPTALIWFCVIAACAALLCAWMWQRASSDADDARQNAAVARTERDDATEALLANDIELANMRDELAAARALPNETDELNDRIADLEAEIERLESDNADLEAFIEAAAAAEAETDAEPAESEAEPAEAETAPDVEEGVDPATEPDVQPAEPTIDAATPFDVASTPQFARYVGEVLSSRNGGSRLGAEQSQCFGGAIINDIGLDALGAGLNNAATEAANNAVVAAMQRAIVECGLDPALVFG